MALEQEQQFFEAHKQDLLQHHAGQFALIKGSELIGTYTTFGEAFDAGIAKLGNVAFLVRPVEAAETLVQAPALVVGVLSAQP